jgi:hypothetical protein
MGNIPACVGVENSGREVVVTLAVIVATGIGVDWFRVGAGVAIIMDGTADMD